MYNLLKLFMIFAVLIILSGCSAENNKKLITPMARVAPIYDNGAIYKPGFNERPLFEERRARNVGDGLIMNVADATPAVKKPANKDKDGGDSAETSSETIRTDEMDFDLSNIPSDALVGTLIMTVMEVMENGSLYVVGGKQMIVDHEYKYVRISGMVDPNNITGGNIIQSTQVSEVRIQVDDVRIRADRTAIRVSEGQNVLGGLFQSLKAE